MEKGIRAIVQAKEEGQSMQYYIRDMNTWEKEMKQKEAALKDEPIQQAIPPIRTRLRREKHMKNKKRNNRKRPATTDYQAWETFDPDKAYEEMENVGPLSLTLDMKQSELFRQVKNKQEAQYEKERGNKYVKVERWDDAIACYNRAIQLIKDDAIYYANRGLCYLKKDSLHQAEQDCTEALRLDPKYVKALQRRATARERLGSLRAACADLAEVLKLEPHNVAAKKQLESIKQRMGTKGRKGKSSPVAPTPKPMETQAKDQTSTWTKTVGKTVQVPPGKIFGVPQASQIQLDREPTPINKVEVNKHSNIANWRDGVGENVLVIRPVKKPPHLRSKRALKTIPIKEIPLGKTIEDVEKPATRMKIIEIDTNHTDDKETNKTIAEKIDSIDDSLNNEVKMIDSNKNLKNDKNENIKLVSNDIIESNDVKNESSELKVESNEVKIKSDEVKVEFNDDKMDSKDMKIESSPLKALKTDMVAPTNSVQFMSGWRNLRGDDLGRCDYLSLLEPSMIPKVFANALESAVLSEILHVLHNHRNSLRPRITDYLKGLAQVKRFSALVMFLSAVDKELLNKLLVHCKTAENCSDEDIADLKNKYEL